VLHPDAPADKSGKYSAVERERRFLLARVPGGPCVRRAELTDRYLAGSRVRLRRTVETTAEGTVTVRKLTQKIPNPEGGPGLLTTFYLSEEEHALFDRLPGAVLVKTRFSLPPLGVDLFGGSLAGLVLGEIEFSDDRSMAEFVPPDDVVAEVTEDVRFTGGRLVETDAPALGRLLAEFEVAPVTVAERDLPRLGPS
jgi:CYTH domain-containing protein